MELLKRFKRETAKGQEEWLELMVGYIPPESEKWINVIICTTTFKTKATKLRKIDKIKETQRYNKQEPKYSQKSETFMTELTAGMKDLKHILSHSWKLDRQTKIP
ncbi:MAG: hypothetical protein Ta2E_08830 [Mycoplasmoidaceae bacterium]|nr:MAG: hypothetical protein Ta2E_08830 [Mycoplasmoidaceae bacterium]